jgi:hypothetical protein
MHLLLWRPASHQCCTSPERFLWHHSAKHLGFSGSGEEEERWVKKNCRKHFLPPTPDHPLEPSSFASVAHSCPSALQQPTGDGRSSPLSQSPFQLWSETEHQNRTIPQYAPAPEDTAPRFFHRGEELKQCMIPIRLTSINHWNE